MIDYRYYNRTEPTIPETDLWEWQLIQDGFGNMSEKMEPIEDEL